jgi:HTH-type transcriptional regulator/antitoxin MqsA
VRRLASRVVDVPGWYPEGDGDAIHSGEDLRAYDEAFKELREAYAPASRPCARSWA